MGFDLDAPIDDAALLGALRSLTLALPACGGPALVARLPQLQAIAHNGGESARAMRVTAALGLPVHRLPSSSPANASWSFDRKLAAWGAVFQQHGLA